MLNNILDQIKELKEIGENATFKLTDNRFLFVEIYAPVKDDEKFTALELNSGYEENGEYVLNDVVDNVVSDYGDEDKIKSAVKYFINTAA